MPKFKVGDVITANKEHSAYRRYFNKVLLKIVGVLPTKSGTVYDIVVIKNESTELSLVVGPILRTTFDIDKVWDLADTPLEEEEIV